jgi:hypothetical protein
VGCRVKLERHHEFVNDVDHDLSGSASLQVEGREADANGKPQPGTSRPTNCLVACLTASVLRHELSLGVTTACQLGTKCR